jgi:hypothetical protein
VIATGWIFDEGAKLKVDECRTHDLKKLLRSAGLNENLNAKLKDRSSAGQEFLRRWETVERWTVTSRYEFKTESEARELFAAITDDPHGVLKWIQTYW